VERRDEDSAEDDCADFLTALEKQKNY